MDKFLTNAIFPLDNVIKAGKCVVLNDFPLIIIEKHYGFYQLYYSLMQAGDIIKINAKLLDLLDRTQYTPLYADITIKGNFTYEGSVFEKLEMPLFHTFIRKTVINEGMKFKSLIDADYAKENNTEEIYDMLASQFDLMCDHIPTKEELLETIGKQQVLKISINKKIAGVLLFEDIGKRSYVRALCVAPDYQNSFVGYSLMADYFNRHNTDKTKLFYLWVDETNTAVRKLHDKFGYQCDGLKNYIFKRD